MKIKTVEYLISNYKNQFIVIGNFNSQVREMKKEEAQTMVNYVQFW